MSIQKKRARKPLQDLGTSLGKGHHKPTERGVTLPNDGADLWWKKANSLHTRGMETQDNTNVDEIAFCRDGAVPKN